MDKFRTSELISEINHDKTIDEVEFKNKEERDFYAGMIKEKEMFKKQTGHKLTFTLPTESYNDMW